MIERCVSVLKKGANGLFRFFFIFSVIGFSVLLILLFTNVVSRNLFNNSFAWIDELTKFIFTWMMFIGIAVSVYSKRQIGMEFLTSKLPPRIRSAMQFICTCAMIAFFFVLAFYGTKYVTVTATMFSPVLNISYGLVYLCLPICGISCIFFCLLDLFSTKYSEQKLAGGEK